MYAPPPISAGNNGPALAETHLYTALGTGKAIAIDGSRVPARRPGSGRTNMQEAGHYRLHSSAVRADDIVFVA
nr:hypothetical protein GCM10010200_089860 [Actinomadura rugatobispora]